MKNLHNTINTIPDIKLTIQSGGSIEFVKTGILPEFLVFHSPHLHRTWRLKLKEDKRNGVLKVNGQIAFYYFFNDLGCKMQSVSNGVVTAEWEIEEILMELRD
ncbi:hypothetical protein [Flavobacterium sp. N3904]|uniref:hypothetical protein n=1 Tax=Flavobacterium sp. N3904 TaxID=2986835 RepID=UPI0022245348|nr:hypothetical protein [Flavobacterium sp. N3904]